MKANLRLTWFAMFSLAATGAPAVAQQPTTGEGPPIVITRRLPPSSDFMVRVVHVADLDLKTVAGQQAMEKRVGQAVEDMCAIPTPLPSYKGRMEKPCRDEAWGSARAQMNDAIQMASAPTAPKQ